MRKASIFTLLFSITFPLYTNTFALEMTTSNDYKVCKEQALLTRENTLDPARKTYLSDSLTITNDAKSKLDSIKWYTNSLYKTEASKIENDRSKKMSFVNEKIAKIRITAQSTWKAEDALCEFNFKKSKEASTKKTKGVK